MEKPTNLDQPAKEESNEALLNRWHQHQDHEAFQVLHDRLVPGLRRFLRRQIETKFEGRGVTTDAVQDILQNVFKSVMRCRAPVRSVNGLLHKAAKRYLLKHVEKATAQSETTTGRSSGTATADRAAITTATATTSAATALKTQNVRRPGSKPASRRTSMSKDCRRPRPRPCGW